MSKPVKTEARERCVRRVYRAGSFIGCPCKLKVKVQRDGQWYCATHDPVEVNRRRDIKAAQRANGRKIRYAAEEHRQALQAAKDAVVEAAKAWETYWCDAMDKTTWPAENVDLSYAVTQLADLEESNAS